jgi:hypothetical protein
VRLASRFHACDHGKGLFEICSFAYRCRVWQVVSPLEGLVAVVEATRTEIAFTAKKLTNDYRASTESVRKAQQKYYEAAALRQDASRAATGVTAGSDRLLRKVDDAAEKENALRREYESTVETARAFHSTYFNTDLPDALHDAQKNLLDFHTAMMKIVNIYLSVCRDVPTRRLALIDACRGVADSMDATGDLALFVKQFQSSSKRPPAPSVELATTSTLSVSTPSLTSSAPSSATNLLSSSGSPSPSLASSLAVPVAAAADDEDDDASGSGKGGGTFMARHKMSMSSLASRVSRVQRSAQSAISALKDRATSNDDSSTSTSGSVAAADDAAASERFFGCSLDSLLAMAATVPSAAPAPATAPPGGERALAAQLQLPWVLVLLCDALLQLDAPSAEGVFRLSGSTSEVARVRAELNRGAYAPATRGDLLRATSSPHTVATLLKQWLRSLDPPLVPGDVSGTVRSFAASQPIAGALQLLPPSHRAVAAFLARWLREHFLTPEVVAVTKMGVDNMTLIFGPCFFGGDISVMHLNNDQDFLRRLFNEMPGEWRECACALRDDCARARVQRHKRKRSPRRSTWCSNPRRPRRARYRRATARQRVRLLLLLLLLLRRRRRRPPPPPPPPPPVRRCHRARRRLLRNGL